MTLSNFHFLRFAQKGHFQGVKFFLTDGQTDRPTNRPTDRPTDKPTYRSSLPELKKASRNSTSSFKIIDGNSASLICMIILGPEMKKKL